MLFILVNSYLIVCIGTINSAEYCIVRASWFGPNWSFQCFVQACGNLWQAWPYHGFFGTTNDFEAHCDHLVDGDNIPPYNASLTQIGGRMEYQKLEYERWGLTPYFRSNTIWQVVYVGAALACSIVSESFCPNPCRSKSSMTILSLSLWSKRSFVRLFVLHFGFILN